MKAMNCTINTIGDNLIVKFCNHLSGCLRKGFVPSSRNHCFVNFSPISRTRSGVSNFTLLLTGNSRRESTRKFMVARHFVMDGEAERTRLEAKLGDRPQLPAVNEYSSQTEKNPDELIVASFYKFSELRNYAEMRQPIRELCEKNVCFHSFSVFSLLKLINLLFLSCNFSLFLVELFWLKKASMEAFVAKEGQ